MAEQLHYTPTEGMIDRSGKRLLRIFERENPFLADIQESRENITPPTSSILTLFRETEAKETLPELSTAEFSLPELPDNVATTPLSISRVHPSADLKTRALPQHELKDDWIGFETMLKQHHISFFYHYTHRKNLKSIKRHGGLISWKSCDRLTIPVPYPGGDVLSRDLDRKRRLQDFVRLSFCERHPMQYRHLIKGQDIVVLKVSPEVALFKETLFSDRHLSNPEKNHGGSLADLKKVRFEATARKYVSVHDADYPYHQAEVCVKTWVPIRFILNLNDY